MRHLAPRPQHLWWALKNIRPGPDLTDDSDFWLRVKVEDAAPFMAAFKDLPDVYHEFRIEQRLGKEIRASTLCAQIIKIEEGPAETRILIRPHPTYGAPY